MREQTISTDKAIESPRIGITAKLKGVMALTKARLNISVVYSALAGYFLGAETFDWLTILMLCLGGYLVVGAANGFNQVLERDRDALMKRTQNRPLPVGTLSVLEGMLASTFMAFAGLWLLYLINPLTLGFGALSLFLYVLVYTPAKARGAVAVFIGAFPGAFPALLGWVAATNDFDIEPGTLFAIQFLWQFAHFWAIGWIADEDYKKAGYSLLPTGKRDEKTARLIIMYTVFTIIVSLLPAFNMTGDLTLSVWGAFAVLLSGVYFLYKAVMLKRSHLVTDARKLMLASVMYLPLIQLIYVLDKFL